MVMENQVQILSSRLKSFWRVTRLDSIYLRCFDTQHTLQIHLTEKVPKDLYEKFYIWTSLLIGHFPLLYIQVEFAPTLKQLATIVSSIAGHLTEAVADIKRLPDILTRKRSDKSVSFTQTCGLLAQIELFLQLAIKLDN